MKIIHCPRRFTQNAWGGTETCLVNLARWQQSCGHQALIYATQALDSVDKSCIAGIPVRRFSYQYPALGLSEQHRIQLDYCGGNSFSFSMFMALLRASNVSVYHAHAIKRIGGIVRSVAKLRKKPYAVTLHGGFFNVPDAILSEQRKLAEPGFEWGKLLGCALGSRRVLQDADVVFCVNQTEVKLAEKALPDTRIEYLPNGVNSHLFKWRSNVRFREQYAIPGQAKLLLCVGRIDPQKNQLLLLEVLADLLKVDASYHLLLVGHVTDQNYYERLSQTLCSLGLSNKVTLVPGLDPESDELIAAYQSADVFCLPSIHEPFGIAILEAWSARVPVIAARVGGIPDFVEHEKDAVLISGYKTEDWTRHIVDLFKHQCRPELVEAGFKKVERDYDWATINQRVLTVYGEIMA